MSGHRTSPSFDIIATTRRRWSLEQKRAIVAEIGDGGATLSEVARRHGLHASQLFRWRADLAATPAPAPDVPAATVQGFMPVMLLPPALPSPAKPSTIEIVIAGGRVVRVGTDVDTAVLVRIISALEAHR
jgi:transposase